MWKRLVKIMPAALAALLLTGCVIVVEEDCPRHPDRCYDCHNSWELDRATAGATCAEYDIVVGSGGYWYSPREAGDVNKKFHPYTTADAGTILGPAAPAE